MSDHQMIHSSSTNEWFTPEKYIQAVRRVLGHIDLDPASCEAANLTIQADEIFTKKDDGLLRNWLGKVFCNPPYGKCLWYGSTQSNQKLWSEKMIEEYARGSMTDGILLVNAQTSEKWFQPLWEYPICFTDHRIKFVSSSGEKSQPTHGNCFVYFGDIPGAFQYEFRHFGHIAIP